MDFKKPIDKSSELKCPKCGGEIMLSVIMSGYQYLCKNYAYCGGRIK